MHVLRNAKDEIIYAATDESKFIRMAKKLATVAGISIDFVKPMKGASSDK